MNRTVETLILIATFSVLALLATAWIGTAVLATGANRAACVAGYSADDLNGSIQICETDTYDAVDTVANTINETRGNRF